MKSAPLLLVALLITSAAQAQQLQGYFVSTTKSFVSDLLFFKDDRFVYNQSTCTGLVKGEGVFSIQHDTLRLRFSTSADPLASVTTCPEQTNGKLAIQVFDGLTNEPLAGATVYIKPAKSSAKQIGAFTTSTGDASLDYIPTATDSLIIAYVGFVTQRIPFTNLKSNCLKITLSFTTYIAAGTTYNFPLESLHQNSFIAHVTSNEQSSYAHFRYKRITASKAQDILKAREQRQ